MTSDQIKHRLDAIEANTEWLREHDLDEHSDEAAKRLGLIKADSDALVNILSGHRPLLVGLFSDGDSEAEP